MGRVRFYTESPSPPFEQLGRLQPPSALLKANITCLVYAEDALSIVHRVPTGLFDQQLLLHKKDLFEASRVLRECLPYTLCDVDPEDNWKDHAFNSKERPHAFRLNDDTLLLVHRDPQAAIEREEPLRILLHAASIYHFDIEDETRTCLNPNPPSQDTSILKLRFPTLAAFYDSLIDTTMTPPWPFVHENFYRRLQTYISHLSTYTVSKQGQTYHSRDEDKPPKERKLLPRCLNLLAQMRNDNRPYLIRAFLKEPRRLSFPDIAMERHALKKEALGDKYNIPEPPFPWHPYSRRKGREQVGIVPEETPFLTKDKRIEWRSVARVLSVARRWFAEWIGLVA